MILMSFQFVIEKTETEKLLFKVIEGASDLHLLDEENAVC